MLMLCFILVIYLCEPSLYPTGSFHLFTMNDGFDVLANAGCWSVLAIGLDIGNLLCFLCPWVALVSEQYWLWEHFLTPQCFRRGHKGLVLILQVILMFGFIIMHFNAQSCLQFINSSSPCQTTERSELMEPKNR